MWLAPAFSLIANAAARVYYRLTIAGERAPARGPVLLVANHPNSLIDPLLVCAAARRPVRFLAKAPLFGDAKTGWMVRAVGAIPVYRRQDDPALMDRNADMFRAAHDALGRGAAVGIFPEGQSHSEPSMVQLRTGAARILLGTLAVHGVRVPIVPVGLVFHDKAIFRSPALVVVGEPVPWEDVGEVRELTERIALALREVTLNLERWEDRPLVETAVAIWDAEFESGPDRARRVQRLEATTRILADLRREPDTRWDALVRDVGGHRRRLKRLRLSPRWLGARADLATGIRWAVSRYFLVMPLAVLLGLAGFMLFFPPYRLTGLLVDRLHLDPDERSTWKLMLGAGIYAAWLALLAVVAAMLWGVAAAAAALVAVPVVGMAGLLIRERWRGAWSDARKFFLVRSRRDLIRALREEQRGLAERLKTLYQERAAKAAAAMTPGLRSLIALLAVLSVPAMAGAQWIARPFHSMDPPSRAVPSQDTPARPIPGAGPVIGSAALGGLAGAAAGFAVGYPLLYLPDRAADLQRGCEDCGLGGAMGTAALMVVSETVGIAVGAHLGNQRRGRLGADLMTSVGALALGAAVAGGVGSVAGGTPTGLVAVTIPVVQIAAVVLVERRAAERAMAAPR